MLPKIPKLPTISKIPNLQKLSKKNMLIIAVIVVCLSGIAYYVYNRHAAPKINNKNPANEEFNHSTARKDRGIKLFYFYADWCPHCKKANEHWNKVKSDEEVGDGQAVNGYYIEYIGIDCTNEKDEDAARFLSKYKVEGFPTIKLVKGADVVEFDAKPDYDILKHFIKSATA